MEWLLVGGLHGRCLVHVSYEVAYPWWGNFTVCGWLMLEQSTHVFDLVRYLILEVVHVQAFVVKYVFVGIDYFEECTTCNLSFENGAIGNATSICVANTLNGFSSELVGGIFT